MPLKCITLLCSSTTTQHAGGSNLVFDDGYQYKIFSITRNTYLVKFGLLTPFEKILVVIKYSTTNTE
jgi:hypothetical protein